MRNQQKIEWLVIVLIPSIWYHIYLKYYNTWEQLPVRDRQTIMCWPIVKTGGPPTIRVVTICTLFYVTSDVCWKIAKIYWLIQLYINLDHQIAQGHKTYDWKWSKHKRGKLVKHTLTIHEGGTGRNGNIWVINQQTFEEWLSFPGFRTTFEVCWH